MENLRWDYIGYYDPSPEAVTYYLKHLTCKLFILSSKNVCYQCLHDGTLIRSYDDSFIFVNVISGAVWKIENDHKTVLMSVKSLYDADYDLSCYPVGQDNTSAIKWKAYDRGATPEALPVSLQASPVSLNTSFSPHYDLLHLNFNSFPRLENFPPLCQDLMCGYRIGLDRGMTFRPTVVSNQANHDRWSIRGVINFQMEDKSIECHMVQDYNDSKNVITYVDPEVNMDHQSEMDEFLDYEPVHCRSLGTKKKPCYLRLSVINCRLLYLTLNSKHISFSTLRDVTKLRITQYLFVYPHGSLFDQDFSIQFSLTATVKGLPRPTPAILLYLYDGNPG